MFFSVQRTAVIGSPFGKLMIGTGLKPGAKTAKRIATRESGSDQSSDGFVEVATTTIRGRDAN